MLQRNLGWILPILAFLIITPFTPMIDIAIARYFFDHNQSFSTHKFYAFLFDYGPLPAQIVAGIAGVVLILSLFISKLKVWRRPAACLILTMAIGAGFLVHAVLKDHWGRPRPKQVIEFGGKQEFRPYYQPNVFNQPEPSKSFSCGHCSMGFYFFALALVGRRLRNTPLFYISLAFALTLGILLSLTRIAQGGHFFSDTLMTALIMWLTAYWVDRLMYSKQGKQAV